MKRVRIEARQSTQRVYAASSRFIRQRAETKRHHSANLGGRTIRLPRNGLWQRGGSSTVMVADRFAQLGQLR